jgi:hypothetical protein
MSYLQRELERINAALLQTPNADDQYRELYIAQQAIAWASDPGCFKSPFRMIMGTSEGLGDCLVPLRQPQSLCSDDRSGSLP